MICIKTYILTSLLFISNLCVAQIVGKPMLVRQDFKNTTNNTVTLTTYKIADKNYLYSGGDGATIDVFSMDKTGLLTAVSSHKLSNDKGTARGLVADRINGTDYLFAGNKAANAVEVFQIQKDGSLNRVFILNDTDKTHLGVVITLQVVHIKQSSFLFVGGLEETPGLSSFKINNDGSLIHIQSQKDDDKIHTDGIIGMFTHLIKGKTFLYTGGFQDNGVSSFRVFDNGTFKNINNIDDNATDRFLTGTYPVTGVTLAGNHYVVVGHRHHKYYKRGNFIKKKDFVYHGDGVSVFKINDKGALVSHSTLINNEQTKLAGQTRIEILSVSDKEAIVGVGTRDDESIQLCKLDANGILTPLSYIKTGYPIYYGLGSLKIEGNLFFVAGSVRFDAKKIVSYKVSPENIDTNDKVLRHQVNLKFKANATPIDIKETLVTFENLKNDIPEIKNLEWGLNDSTEGQSKGFNYGFTITFDDAHAREIYLFHKAHLKLVAKIGPLLEDVFIMDYWVKNN